MKGLSPSLCHSFGKCPILILMLVVLFGLPVSFISPIAGAADSAVTPNSVRAKIKRVKLVIKKKKKRISDPRRKRKILSRLKKKLKKFSRELAAILARTGSRDFFFRGDYVSNNIYNVAFYDGKAETVTTLMPKDLDGTDLNAIALSPDGTKLAISGHDIAVNSDFLYLYQVGDLAANVTLVDTSAVGHFVDITRILFSPDGTQIAFFADIDSDGEAAVYVVPCDGSTPEKRVSQIPPNNGEAVKLAWVTNAILAYIGDMDTDGVNGIWSVDVAAGVPMPTELVPSGSLSATQEIATGNLEVDSQDRIYFRSDHANDDLFQLFRVDPDGNNLVEVPGTAVLSGIAQASIAGYGISPDGKRLAFGTIPNDGEVGQVYVVDLGTGGNSMVTSFAPGTPGAGDFWSAYSFAPIRWSPDQKRIGFAGDWPLSAGDQDNEYAVFVATVADTNAVRITGPALQGNNQDAIDLLFSSDGCALFILGDLVENNDTELFVTEDFTTADQAATALRIVDSPTGGDVTEFTRTP